MSKDQLFEENDRLVDGIEDIQALLEEDDPDVQGALEVCEDLLSDYEEEEELP